MGFGHPCFTEVVPRYANLRAVAEDDVGDCAGDLVVPLIGPDPYADGTFLTINSRENWG